MPTADPPPTSALAVLTAECDPRPGLPALGPAQRRIAECLAVAGPDARLDLVVAIATRPDAEVSAVLDDLAALGVAEAAGASFSFRDPLLRAAVYEGAGPAWRVGAHRRARAYLEHCGGPLPMRAEHCARAAAYGDLAAVATLTAAASAHLDGDPVRAAAWLGAALAILPDQPAHRDTRSELTLLLAKAHALTGALETSLELIQQLLTDRRDGPHRSVAVRYCVAVQRLLGRFEQAEAMLESELAGRPGRSRLLTELAVVRVLRNDPAGAVQAAEAALGGTGQCGERPELAIAATVAALAAAGNGDPGTAIRHLAVAGPLTDALSDTVLREHLHLFAALGWSQQVLGRPADAARQLDRGLRIARRTGQRFAIPYLLTVRANLRLRQGSLAGALADTAAAAEAGTAIGSRETTAMARAVELRAVLWQRGPDAAARRVGDPPRSDRWAEVHDDAVAAIELAARRPQSCVDHLSSRIGRASLVTRPMLRGWLAVARARLGESGAALDDARRAVRDGRDSGLPFGLGAALSAHAQVLLAAGEPEAAAGEAREAVRSLLAAGAPVDAALAQVVLADCLTQVGDLGAARIQLGQAKAAFTQAGARWLAGTAARAEARLGARAARPHRDGGPGQTGPTALTALSERERQVAELAAAGLTNREIAARLYLSARTVEAHLGRVFGKLGVRSRVDVAALVAGDRPLPGSV
ncbi:MAG: hypothetical protein QOJ50_561 [Cryptosporangiaceae bacterium]|nr:hypothetical protein [Cryptosporangiaceae bacterium]